MAKTDKKLKVYEKKEYETGYIIFFGLVMICFATIGGTCGIAHRKDTDIFLPGFMASTSLLIISIIIISNVLNKTEFYKEEKIYYVDSPKKRRCPKNE